MKGLWIPAGALLALGLVMVCLPVYMEMTGVVLLLLGAATALEAALWRPAADRRQRALEILAILAGTGGILLMSAMSLVTGYGQTEWSRAETSEYAVVLGAAVRQDGRASRIMGQRLQAALELMERNPQVTVILSGGQGGDEPVSEARCMYDTLVSMGAPAERLLLEEQSTTTRENLLFSRELIEARGGTRRPVALVTSEFHQRRAAYIADTLRIESCPVSGNTNQWFYRVNYTLREVFAFIKAAAQGVAD